MRAKLLKDRYLAPGETDERQIYDRVANAVHGTDCIPGNALLKVMEEYKWLPNTPTLVNAGRPESGGLSACYVLPLVDSLDGIYKTIWDAAKVHKSFGGTGFNFSSLREAGAPIVSTGGRACGPIKVMELLNTSAGVVMQGGKREGANMGILNDDHPDIQQFIHCKDSGQTLSHFNISVGIHDNTMRDNPGLVRDIAEQAWRTGDPGIIFLDRLNESNIHVPNDRGIPILPTIESTNPCGEQPLRPYESCNLGSINMGKFPEATDDSMAFLDMVELSVRTLDAIIDINRFPIPEIRDATLATRKVGSGLMGWADFLIIQGAKYGGTESLALTDIIGKMYRDRAQWTSHDMAMKKGNYPAWGEHPLYEMRNETLLTIAPTGTLSYLADCSWGIEPIFDWEYKRESESGTQSMKSHIYQVAKDQGLLDDVAKNISWERQVKQVAAWQKWVDNGVSKTINLPGDCTVDTIVDAFILAWKLGCKGITVYRDGSKNKQVVTSQVIPTGMRKAPKDPRVMDGHNVERFGSTLDFNTGCGRIHVTCNEREKDSGIPFEVYNLSDGGCPAMGEALGKLISKYVHDVRLTGDEHATVARIVKTLRKVDCPTAMRNKNSQGKSCPEIVAKRMAEVWLAKGPGSTGSAGINTTGAIDKEEARCPQCGAPATFGLGCRSGSCTHCGWQGCS